MYHQSKHMMISTELLSQAREERLRPDSGSAAVQQLKQESADARPSISIEDNKKVLSRRSQLEIRMDMLAAVKEGAEKPTQIMYKANLSWVALQTQLTQLLERGLLRWVADGSRKRYEITMKGANVMYSYIKILEEIGEDSSDFLEVGM